MLFGSKSVLPLCVAATLAAACGGGSSAVPKAASGLTVEPLSGGAHLTWTDNSDNETDFMIERKTGTGSYSALSSVPFNTTAYHDGTLETGMLYTYHVIAMNAAGMSGPSNEVSLTAAATGDMAMPAGSAACHQVGCRAFSSYCSTTGCKCIGVIADNPDPTCTGTMVTCTADPCQGKTASCSHGTGMCVVP